VESNASGSTRPGNLESREERKAVNVRIIIPPGMNGTRLDVLVAQLAQVSRRMAKRMIDFGAVKVEGKVVKQQSTPVFQNLRVSIRYDPALDVPPPTIDVVHDDEQFLVVSKPAGQPVQATRTAGNSLEDALKAYARRRWVPYVVHRLDMPVSGLLIIPKGDKAAFSFSKLFEGKGITKTYLAIVAETSTGSSFLGEIGTVDSRIHAPLLWVSHKQKAVVSPTGKRSESVVRHLLDLGNGLHLVAVRLVTGRTHQARCHLASVGLPILGDRLYGSTYTYPRPEPTQDLPPEADLPEEQKKPLSLRERVALHAAHLSFPHPSTGEKLSFFLPPPPDFWPPNVELLDMGVFPETLKQALETL